MSQDVDFAAFITYVWNWKHVCLMTTELRSTTWYDARFGMISHNNSLMTLIFKSAPTNPSIDVFHCNHHRFDIDGFRFVLTTLFMDFHSSHLPCKFSTKLLFRLVTIIDACQLCVSAIPFEEHIMAPFYSGLYPIRTVNFNAARQTW